MRKVNLLGAAILALTTSAWSLSAVAQSAPDNSATPSPPADTSSAPADSSSAPDTGEKPMKKPMHHHMGHMGHMGHHMGKGSTAGDAAVDDLNAQSLDAAKSGKSFTPPTTTPTESAEKGSSKGMGMKHGMKHMHHKMAKKAAPASGDAGSTGSSDSSSSTGSGDTSSAPPADSSGK